MSESSSTETRTDSEWIAAFRRGERVKNEYTREKFEKPIDHRPHRWRPICCGTDCDGNDRDIEECYDCGLQIETRCHFDEDMS